MNLKMLKSAESASGGAIVLFFMMRRPSTERLPYSTSCSSEREKRLEVAAFPPCQVASLLKKESIDAN